MLGSLGAIASLSGLERLLSLDAARAASAAAGCAYVPWQARLALTATEIGQEQVALRAAGYELVGLSGYEADGGVRYAGLWEQHPGTATRAGVRLPATAFRHLDESLRSENYGLLAIDGFGVADRARYNGIWDLGLTRDFDLGLTAAAFRDRLADRKSFRPVDISGFERRGRARFAVVWEQATLAPWEASIELTPDEFTDANEQLKGAGYHLVDLSVYVVGDVIRCAAIWNRESGREEHVRVGDSRIDLDSQAEVLRYRGYRPIALDGHDAGGTDRYASVWRNHGISQADERVLDGVIAFFMKDHDIPGLSMAFAKDGRLVYARAFGVARRADDPLGEPAEPLTVRHRFRIASASKPVTAVAIMKLVAEGKLGSNDYVFGPDGLLGTRYGTLDYPPRVLQVQLKHLLHHTAGPGRIRTDPATGQRQCVGGWANKGTGLLWVEPHLTRAELIGHVLDGAGVENGVYELTLDPGSTYAYSGFGYLLLGRIIEVTTGLPYETYVRAAILGPESTMRIAGDTRADRRANEVVYYEQAPDTNPYELEVGRADSSGGWMGSAIDLVRLMTRVDGVGSDDVLTEEARLVMVSPPDPIPDLFANYGKGWSLEREDFAPTTGPFETYSHTGSLNGTSSVMARIRDEDGSVYCWGAILNTRHNPDTQEEDPAPPPRLPTVEYDTSDVKNPMRDWFDLVRAWPCVDLF